jgi:hypothetical protein
MPEAVRRLLVPAWNVDVPISQPDDAAYAILQGY